MRTRTSVHHGFDPVTLVSAKVTDVSGDGSKCSVAVELALDTERGGSGTSYFVTPAIARAMLDTLAIAVERMEHDQWGEHGQILVEWEPEDA